MKIYKILIKKVFSIFLLLAICLNLGNTITFAYNNLNSQSDNSTKEDWSKYFTNDDEIGYDNGAGPGYVWTDKTVQLESNNSKELFNITYSALGSAPATMPADLVLVLDISGSMGDPLGELLPDETFIVNGTTYTMLSSSHPRMYYLMQTINEFIDGFMKKNKENRIAIVLFDSVAYELLPLDRYELTDNNDTYISATRHHYQLYGNYGQIASTVKAHCKSVTKGEDITNEVTSWGNTNLMAGIGAGMMILGDAAQNNNGGVFTRGIVERTPVLIAMTDGEANVFVTDEYNWLSEPNPTKIVNNKPDVYIYDEYKGENEKYYYPWEYVEENIFYYNGLDLFSGKNEGDNPVYCEGVDGHYEGEPIEIPLQSYSYFEDAGLVFDGMHIYAGGRWHYYINSAGGSEKIRDYTIEYAFNSKQKVSDLYNMDMRVYTIGYDLSDSAVSLAAKQTIDPKNHYSNSKYIYNDEYWDVTSSDEKYGLETVFEEIYSKIDSQPKFNPIENSLVYSDKIGDFMEIDGDITIRWANEVVAIATREKNGSYTIVDQSTFINSFGDKITPSDAIEIQENDNVITIKIRPKSLPIYIYDETKFDNKSNNAMPITFDYNVKLIDNVVNENGKLNLSKKGINQYIANGYITEDEKSIYFLSNSYENNEIGANSKFTLSKYNNFYMNENTIRSKINGLEYTANNYYEDTIIDNKTILAYHGNNGIIFVPMSQQPIKDVKIGDTNSESVNNKIIPHYDENNKYTILTYTIEYTNDAIIPITLTIRDEIPKGTIYVPNSADNNGLENDGVITWVIEKLMPNESIVVSYKVSLIENSWEEEIDNVAYVYVGDVNSNNPDVEWIPTNETHNSVPHKSVFNLEDEDINRERVSVNDELTYKIEWIVPSNSDATIVIVQDSLPQGTTFIRASDGGELDSKNNIIWKIDATPCVPQYVTFTVKVNDDAPLIIPNKASITLEGDSSVDTNEVENYIFDIKDEVILEASKELIGGELQDNIFAFNLCNANNDEILQTVYAQSNGKIIFEPLIFTNLDDGKTFKYYIVEVNNGDNYITYDNHKEYITINVNYDKENDKLLFTTIYDNDAIFTNFTNYDIAISKLVTGNLGDLNELFQFKLKLMGDNVPLTIFYTINNETKKATLINNELIFELKHNETITFNGIPYGIVYSIEEIDGESKGYTISIDGEIEGTIKDNINIIFTNTKNGFIATSVHLNVKQIFFITFSAIIAFILFLIINKKNIILKNKN